MTIEADDGTRLGCNLTKRGESGIAVVMLHGLASNLTRWTEFVQNLQIDEDWDLLRLDLRGHGRSIYRGVIGHEQWAQDLHCLLKKLGYKKAVLIGHSLGAQVAIHFALHFPERCKSLVLIDPVFPEGLRGGLAMIAHCRPILWLAIRSVWLLNRLGLRRRQFPSLDLFVLDQQVRRQINQPQGVPLSQLYSSPWRDIKNLPLANYLQDLYEITRPIPSLADIDAPVLVLLSKGGSVASQCITRYRISTMDDAEIQVIDADHWLLTEQPDTTRSVIEHWVTQRV